MSLTETRTKLLSGSEVCPPVPLPSSHCIITSNIVVYRILRTIGRYIFFLNTLASTYRPHRPIQG